MVITGIGKLFKIHNLLSTVLGELQGLAQLHRNSYKKTFKKPDEKTRIGLWDELHLMISAHNEYYFGLNADANEARQVFSDMIYNFKMFVSKVCQFYSVELHNRTRLIKNEDWRDELEFFDPFYEEETAISDIADQLILLNNEKSESAYLFLKHYLFTHSTLSKALKYAILTYLTSYLEYKLKNNNPHLVPDVVDLYKYGISENVLMYGNVLPYRMFINIIDKFCYLEKYDWCESFIAEWHTKVGQKHSDKVREIGIAKVAFYKKEFDVTIKKMSSFDHPSYSLTVNARWLLLQAIYETNKDNYALFKALSDSYKTVLNNKKTSVTNSTYEGMINTIKVLLLLYQINKHTSVVKIMDRDIVFFNKVWLKEKIKEKGIQLLN